MTQATFTLNQLKNHLTKLSHQALIAEVVEVFKLFPEVREFYQIKLAPKSEDNVADKYKKIIREEFFPKRGLAKMRLAVAKKAISDFKKICNSESALIDLMLFYVEEGVEFTLTYGDITEPFYDSMEGVYQKALKRITSARLDKTFQRRCWQIVLDTSNTGWGFGDTLAEMYETAFSK